MIPFKWKIKCQCFEEKLKALVTSLNTMDSNNRTHSANVSFGLFSNKEHYSLYSNIRPLSLSGSPAGSHVRGILTKTFSKPLLSTYFLSLTT